MACHASGAEFALVNGRLGMARYASLGGALVKLVRVTGRTSDFLVFAGQLEGGAFVIEVGEVRQCGVRALVLGVAGHASLSQGELAVHRFFAVNLSADVLVTVHATRRHRLAAPSGGMTCRATGDFGVRGDAAARDLLAVLFAQRSRAEHGLAEGDKNEQNARQCAKNADLSQAQTCNAFHVALAT